MFFYFLRHYSTIFFLWAHSSSLALFPHSWVTVVCTDNRTKTVQRGLKQRVWPRVGQWQCSGHQIQGSWKPKEILGLLQGDTYFFFPAYHTNSWEDLSFHTLDNAGLGAWKINVQEPIRGSQALKVVSTQIFSEDWKNRAVLQLSVF